MRSVLTLLSTLSWCAGVALASSARAQSSAPEGDEGALRGLSVTREEGAEGCPGTSELSEHVARLRGKRATGAPGTYRVTFSRPGGVFRATIRMAGGGARVLKDRGQDCASLEQATALTLALLFDSDDSELTVEEHEQEPPAEPEPEPERAPTIEPAPVAARPPPSDIQLALSVGGGALFGVVQSVVPVTLADAGLFVNRFHASVGLLWVPTQQLDHAPGQLRESLLSGVARTCYAPLSRRKWRLQGCTGIYAGLFRVEARGYTRNDAVKRAWLAVPLELSLSTEAPPVGVELGMSALLPLRQSDFAIDNLGTAYESWPVGGLITLRARGSWVL